MASKIKSVYICSECGYESPKWYGKCPSCGEWNTMNEEIKDTSKQSATAKNTLFCNLHQNHMPYRIFQPRMSTDMTQAAENSTVYSAEEL